MANLTYYHEHHTLLHRLVLQLREARNTAEIRRRSIERLETDVDILNAAAKDAMEQARQNLGRAHRAETSARQLALEIEARERGAHV